MQSSRILNGPLSVAGVLEAFLGFKTCHFYPIDDSPKAPHRRRKISWPKHFLERGPICFPFQDFDIPTLVLSGPPSVAFQDGDILSICRCAVIGPTFKRCAYFSSGMAFADRTVLDLPQLYQKPNTDALLKTLASLKRGPRSWKATAHEPSQADPKGAAQYLTSIIASPLKWIASDQEREEIWEQASLRLSERSGRSGMSAMTRNFDIMTPTGSIQVTIHEPALTSDNLGLKTWASSYLLAQRLQHHDFSAAFSQIGKRILELGAGTGLVGIAAAAVFGVEVCLTDLPEIQSNLRTNVTANLDAIQKRGGSAVSGVLDWSRPTVMEIDGQMKQTTPNQRYPIVLAADSIYSADHPRMLVEAISSWLSLEDQSRVLVELPRRLGYESEIEDFEDRMHAAGFSAVYQDEDYGYDDWGSGDADDSQSRVQCWFSVWQWSVGPNQR